MTDAPSKSQQAIIDAAFATYAQRPTATLAEVAEAAGVGRATLHRYFPGRQDLMVALARIASAELDAAIEAATAGAESHGAALRRALFAMVPLGDRQWFLATEPVDLDLAIAADYGTAKAVLATEIDAAKAEGIFDPGVPTDWIAAAYDDLIYTAWSAVRDQKLTPNQAADLAWRTLIAGLGPAEGDSHVP
ncbi:MAG: helix-turn-helix domain-containing protein [Pseudomonadota bacterium]